MRIRGGCTIIVLFAAGLAGCRSDGRLLRPAGTITKQQSNATVFDPYTDNELGPVVEGGRPRDFQKPLSDSDRSRLFQKFWNPF